MEVQLFENEVKKREVILDNYILTLTNKRLLYSNSLNHNKEFIGIAELRSAEASTVDVVYNKFEINDWGTMYMRIAFFLTVSFGIYMAFSMNSSGEEFYYAVIIGMVFSTGIAAVAGLIIMLIIKILISATSKKMKRAMITVIKTDNSYFLNNHFEIDKLTELRQVENDINSLIYQ